jgi:tetratricopeptide (TPR) repeat protein
VSPLPTSEYQRAPSRVRSWCLLLLLAGFAGSILVRRALDAETRPSASTELLYVSSGDQLRRFSLGYNGLLADIYWTRAVQYFGRQRLQKTGQFDALGPLLRVATTLDPHLLIAYRFGAIFLAEKPPAGAGKPEEALQLLRHGIVANPDYWRLWQDLGFIYYWDLHDYARAAQAFKAGSEQPGAEVWMKAMAATVASQGGELSTSRLLWSQMYRQAANESIRRSALLHLAALQAATEIAQLNELLRRYQEVQGQPARSFAELVRAGLLNSEPRDPSRAPYVIGRDGRAQLSPSSGIDLGLAE